MSSVIYRNLVLEAPSGEITVVEIKRTLSPKISRGYTESFNTLKATKGYVVIPRGERFPPTKETEAINLPDVLTQLSSHPNSIR